MRGATRISGNEALIGLLQALPDLAANRPTPSRALSILRELERDLETTGWTLPPGFDTVDFSVNGLGGPVWLPAIGRSIGVISPFCDPHALTVLTPKYVKAAHLVSRAEELALIPEAVRARFAQISVLDDLAETADGEDTEADPADLQTARGLHAKAFISERGSATDITVGSGNATSAALVNGSNVEVFATLTGLTSRIGSVSDHLSPDRLGRFLRPFEAIEGAPVKADPRAWMHNAGYVSRGADAGPNGEVPANIKLVPVYDTEDTMHVRIPWKGVLTAVRPEDIHDEKSYGTSAAKFPVLLAR